MVHVLIWQEAHGPVPKGHIIVFRDGNLENLSLDNLECISRAENMRRNTVCNYPHELREVIRLRGLINRQINKRARA